MDKYEAHARQIINDGIRPNNDGTMTVHRDWLIAEIAAALRTTEAETAEAVNRMRVVRDDDELREVG